MQNTVFASYVLQSAIDPIRPTSNDKIQPVLPLRAADAPQTDTLGLLYASEVENVAKKALFWVPSLRAWYSSEHDLGSLRTHTARIQTALATNLQRGFRLFRLCTEIRVWT